MRVFLISLILLSHLFLYPLAKNDMLFSKSVVCKKSDEGVKKPCTSNDEASLEKSPHAGKKTMYRVVSGDNLSSIAEKHSVSVSDLMSWNHLNENDKIYRGQKLAIFAFRRENPKSQKLSAGQSISLYRPVNKGVVIKGYVPYGDNKNFGILYKINGENNIKPANSGTVVKISNLRGYGKYILIDHGSGWHSLYSNLNDVKVKSGQYVNFSESIGNAKDNKLFFLLAYNGKPVNPTGYFKTTARD